MVDSESKKENKFEKLRKEIEKEAFYEMNKYENLPTAYYEIQDLEIHCRSALQIILENLLLLTNRNITSQKDSQILTTKILMLLQILIQWRELGDSKEAINSLIRRIQTADSSNEYKTYIQKKGVTIDLKRFISFIQNFNEKFVSPEANLEYGRGLAEFKEKELKHSVSEFSEHRDKFKVKTVKPK